MSASNSFGWDSFFIRLAFALVLVVLTYNPSGYSYAHWLLNSISPVNLTPYLAISGIAIVIGWVIYIRATLRSLGVIGLALASLLFACVLWILVDIGWLSLNALALFQWLTLIIISTILAIGMSWSHVRRKMSGQVDTDDVDE